MFDTFFVGLCSNVVHFRTLNVPDTLALPYHPPSAVHEEEWSLCRLAIITWFKSLSLFLIAETVLYANTRDFLSAHIGQTARGMWINAMHS